MPAANVACKTGRWSLDDIDFDSIEMDFVRDNELLFFVVASASLVESQATLYANVLLKYFEGEAAGVWLRKHWMWEETQHGRALRHYVELVWPEFDWQRAYATFCDEYSSYCSVEALEPTPALELVARCVVETGTAALYRALQDATEEPVLKRLTGLIWRDEVRHYKHFHRYFIEHNRSADHGRWPIARALSRRLTEVRNEDADCALRHVFAERYPETPIDSLHFERVSRGSRALVMRHISPEMMVRMLLQPLALPMSLRNVLQAPCAQAMRLFMSH